jgi:CheY-like chemotaxis protein
MMSVAPTLAANLRGGREMPYVLLVDDHEPSLKQLSEVVRGAGYWCSTASSATLAVGQCDHRRPQVVVTDLSMPNLDGRGLADWIKARHPSLPLILMTG